MGLDLRVIFKLTLLFIFSLVGVAIRAIDLKEYSNFTYEKGLSNNNVTFLFQDKNKFIWIGTSDGLNFFDGDHFKVYRNKGNDSTSLSDNAISCIFQDSKNRIWIGTTRGGISIYNPKTDGFIRMNDVYNKGKLTNGFITGIAEDRLGFIWISTIWGLNRYNPSNGSTTSFYSKYTKELLIKIAEANKTIVPPNFIDKFKKIQNERGHYLKSDVYAMCYSEYGFAKAIELIDFFTKNAACEQNESILDNKLRAVESDEQGNIWVGYEYGGISKIDCSTLKFKHYLSGIDRSVKQNNVFCLLPLRDKVYVGNQSGELEAVDIRTGKYTTVLANVGNISQIKKFDNTSIWIAAHQNITVLNTSNNKVKNFSDLFPEYKNIATFGGASLLTDSQGNKWVGTYNKGFFLMNQPKGFHMLNKLNALADNEVRPIYVDLKDQIWVGYLNPLVEIFDANFNKIKTLAKSNNAGLRGTEIFQFRENEQHKMHISGLESGLQEYDIEKNQFEHQVVVMDGSKAIPLNNLTRIVKSTDGTWWFSTMGDGIIKYNYINNEYKIYRANYEQWRNNLPSDWLFDLAIDKSDILWVGSTNGLCKVNPRTEAFFTYNKLNSSMLHDVINCVYLDDRDNIWVGTKAGLFIIENKTQKQFNLTTNEGLPSNEIKSIIQDKKNKFWVSSNMGLASFEAYEKEKLSIPKCISTIQRFDVFDGLSSNEFADRSSAITSKGVMLFGSNNGITRFHPDSLLINNISPPIFFTYLKLFYNTIEVNKAYNKLIILSKPLYQTDTVVFDYSQNVLTFEFEALNYIQPHKNQYKYQLSGFNENWQYLKNRNEVNFTNLKPGTYKLKVCAANNDGVWNNAGKTLVIIIRPPFWGTVWFQLLLVLGVLSVILILYRVRVRTIRRANKLLRAKVTERTLEITKKNKMLLAQAEQLSATNTLLQERQQNIEEQAEELIVQRDKLEDLNTTKDKLFSILAHDLKSPFNTIIGFSEVILENINKYPLERIEKQVKYIYDASRFTYNLLENLLQWSRSQRGVIEFNPEHVRISDCIKNDLRILIQQAERKNIIINIDILGEERIVKVDQNMLSVIIRNLAYNAIKYSQKGASINLTFEYKEQGVQITVSDKGIGLNEEQQRKIFSMSNTISMPGTSGEKGTGLGLLLCSDFVKKHGGILHVESKEKEGSSFFFTIPY